MLRTPPDRRVSRAASGRHQGRGVPALSVKSIQCRAHDKVSLQSARQGKPATGAVFNSLNHRQTPSYPPVQDLLNKIEAAAEARLSFSPNATAAEKVARYKTFLKVEAHRLKLLHRAGADGREICQARAAILDALLKHLWESAKESLSAPAQKEFPSLALVAIGGFGRAELNPHSDVDFMFLHEGQVVVGKPKPYLAKLIDGVLYPLWDIGLKIGYSVRDLNDCVKVANTDMQSKTSLIESRLIVGDEKLFSKFQTAVVSKCVVGYEDKYIALRLEDQASRRNKHGNSACMQEPNIKNGCGGLRDFQNLLWMAFFKYRTRSLPELQAREFVSPAERKQLEAAYDFLLRVRTELHYHSNRPQEVLGKNLQPAVALNLGYGDRSPSLRIEKFMRDLYVHMRNIYLITRTLEQRMVLSPSQQTGRLAILRQWLPGATPRKLPEPVDGFLFVGDEIRASSNRIFRDSPRRLMRVFLHAQQRHLRLHPDLAQLIRNQLSLVNREFLNDEHVRETFLTILDRRGEVSPVLRAMHEVNFLGKYIPEFGRLTCLVQHEFYHQYSADEHTLVCLEQLDKIWEAKEPPFKNYAPFFLGLERPGLLYLALLLHDVGKAAPHEQGKHAEMGAIVGLGDTLQLEAVQGGSTLSPTWSVLAGGGTINSAGVYTAPNTNAAAGYVPVQAESGSTTEQAGVAVSGAFPGLVNRIYDYADFKNSENSNPPEARFVKSVAVNGNRAYTISIGDLSSLRPSYEALNVYDITNPDAPLWIDAGESASNAPAQLFSYGNTLFSFDSTNLVVYSLAAQVPSLTEIVPVPSANSSTFNNGVLYLATGAPVTNNPTSVPVDIFDFTGGNPVHTSYALPEPSQGGVSDFVVVSGNQNTIYACWLSDANNTPMLSVASYDISQSPPTLVSTIVQTFSGPPEDQCYLQVVGNLLFANSVVYDISNVTPVQVGTVPNPLTLLWGTEGNELLASGGSSNFGASANYVVLELNSSTLPVVKANVVDLPSSNIFNPIDAAWANS